MSETIVFPKKWKELSEEEQKAWINSYYMPKTRMPEPVLLRKGKIKEGILKLENGAKIRSPTRPVIVTKNNPSIVREFEFWVEKWPVTVFYNKSMPYIKYIGISNPSSNKWIAQELSHEILCKLFTVLCKIGNKYGLFRRKKPKIQRKDRDFTLGLRDNRER
jgi:hypothetical protein